MNFFSQSQLIIPIPQSHLGVTIIFLLIILAASGILYVSSLKKLAVFTALVLTAVFSFGLYSIPKKENSFVAYLSTGSTYSLVFNSKNSDKILVGIDGNILRYNKNFDSGGYSCVLTLDKPRDYQMDYLSEINYGSLISYQNPNKTEKITEVSTNTDLQIGDFSFNFIENNDNIMGILIVMDNVKYFVATALYECYDLYYQTLDILKPQVVFAGFLDELAKNDEYFCITQSKVQGAECSFESDGDMILRMNKNKLLRRCID